MQEEVKTLRTMKQFIAWYQDNAHKTSLPSSLALDLNDFYIKFKYLVKEEDDANEYLKNFLG
jgi:hypothetical protein